MRRAHWLKGNKKSESIQHAIWFDTETDQIPIGLDVVQHVLKVGYAAYSSRGHGGRWTDPVWCRFETVAEFWDFVISKNYAKTKLHMFCHNTNFDLGIVEIFDRLPDLGYELKFAVIDGPPTILKFVKDKKSIVMLDTLNFWRQPLKVLGESIGLKKLPMPAKTASPEEWNTYCRRDTEIIMVAIQRWTDRLVEKDYGGFAYTVAGQAFRLFRHRYMGVKIGIHNNQNANNLERDAYKGGRNECFFIGQLNSNYMLLDVNSMYPYVMQQFKFPTKLKYFSRSKNIKDLHELLKHYAVIAKVTLDTTDNRYCTRYNGKLIFPVGEFTTTLCTPEIISALKAGDIIKVHEVSVYQQDYIFKQYVDDLFREKLIAKKNDNKIDIVLYKSLLNNLYGKFGQKGLVYEKIKYDPKLPSRTWINCDIDTNTTVNYRCIAGLVQQQKDEVESRDSFCGIAAHVTAYAREYLQELIHASNKYAVTYCDTDSVCIDLCLCDHRIFEYIRPNLGGLKNEMSFCTGKIYACKDYVFGDKKTHKGIKRSATWPSENSAVQERWSSLIGQLRAQNLNVVYTAKVTKTLKRQYTKGYVLPGGRVLPYVFAGGPDPIFLRDVLDSRKWRDIFRMDSCTKTARKAPELRSFCRKTSVRHRNIRRNRILMIQRYKVWVR